MHTQRQNFEKSYRERVLEKVEYIYSYPNNSGAIWNLSVGKNEENLYEQVLKAKYFPAGLCINIKIDGESSKFMKD